MRQFFILAMLIAAASGAQAETYRWVDESGKVHYGDQIPNATVRQIEERQFGDTSGPADAGLPYETRRAMKGFPVTLYVTVNCIEACKKARDFLNKRGVPFSEKLLATQEEIDNFVKQSGSDQSPTLAVGTTYLKGFEAGPWNNELDFAGYPKTAPYRPQAAKPKAENKPAATQEGMPPPAEAPQESGAPQ